jgi:hypothetical protein
MTTEIISAAGAGGASNARMLTLGVIYRGGAKPRIFTLAPIVTDRFLLQKPARLLLDPFADRINRSPA